MEENFTESLNQGRQKINRIASIAKEKISNNPWPFVAFIAVISLFTFLMKRNLRG